MFGRPAFCTRADTRSAKQWRAFGTSLSGDFRSPLKYFMEKVNKEMWLSHFQNIGITPNLIDMYMAYINIMYMNHVPPIFEFVHLAGLLGRTESFLASVINSPSNHYRVFQIPKRKGGIRKIKAPYPALLECQQWINKEILSEVRLHKACHGFREKKSILTNARVHLHSNVLLKMDLQDFFDNIQERRVIRVFRRLGYPPNVSFYLARICCVDGSLVQGAATSPCLSNIISKRLDFRLYGYARSIGLKYTRYADDLTFSGEYISAKIIFIIQSIIREEGFQVNENKTRLYYKKGQRIVTGISIVGDKPKVPKPYKRLLRQEIHFVEKYGILSHMSRRRIRNPLYVHSLYGKLAFWKWVEPDNDYAQEAMLRIKKLFKS